MRLVLTLMLVINSVLNSANGANSAMKLKVYMGNIAIAPYDIHSSGNVLANFNSLVLGHLINNKNGFDLEPGILESFKYDFDTDSYILKLKPNTVFHDGTKATSKDLEFTLLRGFFGADKSFFHTYLGNIKGVREVKVGDKFESGIVPGVRIIDNLTVAVELIGPNPSFFHSLTAAYFSLVPRKAFKSDYLSWKEKPIGTGPYQVAMAFDGEKTLLKKFDPSSKFDEIELHTLYKEKANYDLSLEPIQSMKEEVGHKPAYVRMIEFSNQHPLSKNKDFRKLVYSVCKEVNYSDDAGKIVDTNEILPSHFWGHSDEHDYSANITKIKENLDLERIDFIVFAGKTLSEKHKYYASKLEKAFQKYGIKVTFTPNSEKFVSKETATKFPVRMVGVIADYVDPLIMFSAYRKLGHNIVYRPLGEVVEKYEELYLKAELSETFDKRLKTVKELNNYARINHVILPIAEERLSYFYNPDLIKNLGDQQSPLMINLQNIEMVK